MAIGSGIPPSFKNKTSKGNAHWIRDPSSCTHIRRNEGTRYEYLKPMGSDLARRRPKACRNTVNVHLKWCLTNQRFPKMGTPSPWIRDLGALLPNLKFQL